jgi:hypothetical protein
VTPLTRLSRWRIEGALLHDEHMRPHLPTTLTLTSVDGDRVEVWPAVEGRTWWTVTHRGEGVLKVRSAGRHPDHPAASSMTLRAIPAPQEAVAGDSSPGTGERPSEPSGGPCAASYARDGGSP